MGGRGSSSGIGDGGYKITSASGESQEYFFKTRGGNNYYQRGISGRVEMTPNNMSPNEFINRVKKNGGKVEKISNREIKKMEADYKRGRKKIEQELNKAWYSAGPRPRKGMKGH